MNSDQAIFMFNCPIHGLEHRAFCFRAFSSEHNSLWKKFLLVEQEMDDTDYKIVKDFIQYEVELEKE